jgi:hemerythrin-like domain-containing protein
MYSVEELKQQNQDICDLCDVLSVLMEQKSLHDNPYVCDLMARFREKVWMHLVFEDNTLYAQLARHQDQAVSETARSFHDNAREIKQHFSSYVRRWCQPALSDAEHQVLVEQSREIFRLIRERVDYENKHMFPLLD